MKSERIQDAAPIFSPMTVRVPRLDIHLNLRIISFVPFILLSSLYSHSRQAEFLFALPYFRMRRIESERSDVSDLPAFDMLSR